MTSLTRHCFVRLAPGAEPSGLCGSGAVLAEWLAGVNLAIVRGRRDGDDPDLLPLGAALPNDLARRRIGFQVSKDAVSDELGQPTPSEVAVSAPTAWRPALSRLAADLSVAGLTVGVYGSLAWQHLTKRDYLRDGSDLDLVVEVSSMKEAGRAVRVLGEVEAKAPFRIDGEVRLPDGRAVNWREYALGNDEVMVKAEGGVALLSRTALFAEGAV